jgi:hypothetical protein
MDWKTNENEGKNWGIKTSKVPIFSAVNTSSFQPISTENQATFGESEDKLQKAISQLEDAVNEFNLKIYIKYFEWRCKTEENNKIMK